MATETVKARATVTPAAAAHQSALPHLATKKHKKHK
jgi:hypothetical protein